MAQAPALAQAVAIAPAAAAAPAAAEPAFQTIHTKREVPQEEWAGIFGGPLDPGFHIETIYEIENKPKAAMFAAQCDLISQQLGGADPNRIQGYHVTKTEDFDKLLDEGLDTALSQRGFFGKAISIADNMQKANDYSKFKGDPIAVRTMLLCSVAVGKAKEFEIGRFDRDLITAPIGFHSIKGFIRRGFEYGVYNNNQVLITHMITYKYFNINDEVAPIRNLPANTTGNIAYITAPLSEFFSKIESRGSNDTQRQMIKRYVGLLLKQQITPEQFVSYTETVLRAAAPAGLADKLKTEMAKCQLPTALSAGTSTLGFMTVTGGISTTAPITPSTDPSGPGLYRGIGVMPGCTCGNCDKYDYDYDDSSESEEDEKPQLRRSKRQRQQKKKDE